MPDPHTYKPPPPTQRTILKGSFKFPVGKAKAFAGVEPQRTSIFSVQSHLPSLSSTDADPKSIPKSISCMLICISEPTSWGAQPVPVTHCYTVPLPVMWYLYLDAGLEQRPHPFHPLPAVEGLGSACSTVHNTLADSWGSTLPSRPPLHPPTGPLLITIHQAKTRYYYFVPSWTVCVVHPPGWVSETNRMAPAPTCAKGPPCPQGTLGPTSQSTVPWPPSQQTLMQ